MGISFEHWLDGPGGTVQPAAAAGSDNFMGPFAVPSRARARRAD
jgi:hypothetical protein